MPLAERRAVRGLMPARAPTIVAGSGHPGRGAACGPADRLTVSERDILHGAALSPRMRLSRGDSAARVAELVDAADLKSSGRKAAQVRTLSRASCDS